MRLARDRIVEPALPGVIDAPLQFSAERRSQLCFHAPGRLGDDVDVFDDACPRCVIPRLADPHRRAGLCIAPVPAILQLHRRIAAAPLGAFDRARPEHPAAAAPVVRREMRGPERMVWRQDQPVPGEVMKARLQRAAVAVDPVAEVSLDQLGVAPGHVGGAHVGAVDRAHAPVAALFALVPGPAVPSVLLDDPPEIAPEGFEPGALGDGLVHRRGQVGQQVGLGSAGHHEGPVVLVPRDVVPARGRHQAAQPQPEGCDLLGERAAEGTSERLSHRPRPRPRPSRGHRHGPRASPRP